MIRELGDQYHPKLREGWVRYLAAEESGQSVHRLVDAGPTKKIILDDLLCPTTASGGIKAGESTCSATGVAFK